MFLLLSGLVSFYKSTSKLFNLQTSPIVTTTFIQVVETKIKLSKNKINFADRKLMALNNIKRIQI